MTDILKASEAYAAKGATAPRVTLESMEAKIAEREFFVHGLLTLCVLKMQNGFYVVGESAPASAANFDEEKGRTFAYENAIRQLWKLEGYALREVLAAQAHKD